MAESQSRGSMLGKTDLVALKSTAEPSRRGRAHRFSPLHLRIGKAQLSLHGTRSAGGRRGRGSVAKVVMERE